MTEVYYCVKCQEPLDMQKLLTDIKSEFLSTAYYSNQFGVCTNEKCPRYGLLSTYIRRKENLLPKKKSTRKKK